MKFSYALCAFVLVACQAADPIDSDRVEDTSPAEEEVLPAERTVAFTQVGAYQLSYHTLYDDGESLYAQKGTELWRSSDVGRSWESLGAVPGDRGFASDGAGRLYRMAADNLYVYEAATWLRYDDPFGIEPAQQVGLVAAPSTSTPGGSRATSSEPGRSSPASNSRARSTTA